MLKLSRVNCDFEREPLVAPFGFKGGYVNEIWQSAVMMENSNGDQSVGLGTQSVLWSDGSVFVNNAESAGNSMMFLVTSYALKQAEGKEWKDPLDLLDQLLPLFREQLPLLVEALEPVRQEQRQLRRQLPAHQLQHQRKVIVQFLVLHVGPP